MESPHFLNPVSAGALSVIPLLAFAGLMALCLRRKCEPENCDWREAFLRASVVWAALTFAFTELLSLFSALHALALALCWGCTVLAVLILLLRSGWRLVPPGSAVHLGLKLKGLSRGQKALCFWIAISLAITAAIALVSPPNNWDSMVYHMSRVVHWWVNGTVAFYPTNIQRQLYSSPLAEYMILQFFVLGGGSDRFANLVQWFCFSGAAIALSLLARRLGADRLTQLLAAFVVLTAPTDILEATSTQNDLACAFLTATTLYFLYCDQTIWTGVSLGLAILVKSPAGLAVCPFFLLLFLRQPLQLRNIVKAAGRLAVIMSIAFALNAPFWLRNMHTFHDPLGYTDDVKEITSQAPGFRPFVVNTVRDLATELETPSLQLSKMEERGIRRAGNALRLNIDDPRNSFKRLPFVIGTMSADEEVASNPLETALLIAATVFLLASRRLRTSEAAKFAVFVWVGFLLIAWRISWQPWITRIQAPFLVLSSLPVAVFLNWIHGRFRFVAVTIVAVLAVASLDPLLHNWMRPFVSVRQSRSIFVDSRADIYFVRRRGMRSCYEKTIAVITSNPCRQVGVKLGDDDWEYPLWALARSKGDPIDFEQIDVENETRSARAGFQGATCTDVTLHHAASLAPNTTQSAWIELHSVSSNGAQTIGRIDCHP